MDLEYFKKILHDILNVLNGLPDELARIGGYVIKALAIALQDKEEKVVKKTTLQDFVEKMGRVLGIDEIQNSLAELQKNAKPMKIIQDPRLEKVMGVIDKLEEIARLDLQMKQQEAEKQENQFFVDRVMRIAHGIGFSPVTENMLEFIKSWRDLNNPKIEFYLLGLLIEQTYPDVSVDNYKDLRHRYQNGEFSSVPEMLNTIQETSGVGDAKVIPISTIHPSTILTREDVLQIISKETGIGIARIHDDCIDAISSQIDLASSDAKSQIDAYVAGLRNDFVQKIKEISNTKVTASNDELKAAANRFIVGPKNRDLEQVTANDIAEGRLGGATT